ncbi:hypothetical protein DsansV1_C23g0178991 [Dioscorea sansibarensis]
MNCGTNMSIVKRWAVTYTKHLKQKRKVYQDGVLELCGSGKKLCGFFNGKSWSYFILAINTQRVEQFLTCVIFVARNSLENELTYDEALLCLSA